MLYWKLIARACAVTAMTAGLGACATSNVQNAMGASTVYVAPGSGGPVQGVGIQTDDVNAIVDDMLRELLVNPQLMGRATPPRILVDASLVRNRSAQIIDQGLFTDRLRSLLNRNANGRLSFVNRTDTQRIEQERSMRRDGTVDVGTTGLTRATAGVDYQIRGDIASMEAIDPRSGMQQRTTQIIFEMTDMESGVLIWSSKPYDMTKAAANNVVYR